MSIGIALAIAILGYLASINNVGAEYLKFTDDAKKTEAVQEVKSP